MTRLKFECILIVVTLLLSMFGWGAPVPSNCTAFLAQISEKSISGDTQAYLHLTKYLAKEKNVLSSEALLKMIQQDSLQNPLHYLSRDLSPEYTFSFDKAFNSLKQVDWLKVRAALKDLSDENQSAEVKRSDANKQTQSILYSFVLKKDFLLHQPHTIDRIDEYRSKDGNHYLKYRYANKAPVLVHLETGQSMQFENNVSQKKKNSFIKGEAKFFETSSGDLLMETNDGSGLHIFDLKKWSFMAHIPNKFPNILRPYGFEANLFQTPKGEVGILLSNLHDSKKYMHAIDLNGDIIWKPKSMNRAPYVRIHQLDDGTIYLAEAFHNRLTIREVFSEQKIFDVPLSSRLDFDLGSVKTHLIRDTTGAIFLAVSVSNIKNGSAFTRFYKNEKGDVKNLSVNNDDTRLSGFELDSKGQVFFLHVGREVLSKIDPTSGKEQELFRGPRISPYLSMHVFRDGSTRLLVESLGHLFAIDVDEHKIDRDYDMSSLHPGKISAVFDDEDGIKAVEANHLVQLYGVLPEKR